MTDPMMLAESIDAIRVEGPYCADQAHRHVEVTVTEAEALLLAAALRLAEVIEPVECGFGDNICPACGEVAYADPLSHEPDCVLIAYRAAKEGK
jgi:hypothetical protein